MATHLLLCLLLAASAYGTITVSPDGATLTWEQGGTTSMMTLVKDDFEDDTDNCTAVFDNTDTENVAFDQCDGTLQVNAIVDGIAYTKDVDAKLADLLAGTPLEGDLPVAPPQTFGNGHDDESEPDTTTGSRRKRESEDGRRRKRKAGWKSTPSCPAVSLNKQYRVNVRAFADNAMFRAFLAQNGGNKDAAKAAIKARIRADFQSANSLYRSSSLTVHYVLVLESVKIMTSPVPKLQGLASAPSITMNNYLNAFRDAFSRAIGGGVNHITLFTGQDNFSVKALEGLSSYAKMCDRRESISIVKYNVRQRGVNLAHEIGHSLGLSHDGDNGPGCPANPKLIMSGFAANVIKWSQCSIAQAPKWVGCWKCLT